MKETQQNKIIKVCDKCGCTEFVLGMFSIDIGGLPFVDNVYYCKECGEIWKCDKDRYKVNIEVNNERNTTEENN